MGRSYLQKRLTENCNDGTKRVTKMKRIIMLALFGAFGFGIGGLFPGPATLLGFGISFQRTEIWPLVVIVFVIVGFGFAARGALGGTALGLALRGGRRMTANLALWGAIGFLIGGLVNILPMVLVEFGGGMIDFLDEALGVAVLGGLGGTALGLSLSKVRRRTIAVALLGGIGVVAGGFLGAFLSHSFLFFRSGGGMLQVAPPGIALLDGALGGVVLGLALRGGRTIIGLGFAGSLGFWLGSLIANYLQSWLGFGFLLTFAMFSVQGIIGGASLGATLGYLEKQKAMQYT